MSVYQNKSWFINFFAIAVLTAGAAYYIIENNLSAKSEQVAFVNLTNADIDKILAVKAEMQNAKIQANLGF